MENKELSALDSVIEKMEAIEKKLTEAKPKNETPEVEFTINDGVANKAFIEIVDKKRVEPIRIKAAANSQLSAGAGSNMTNVEMGPFADSINAAGIVRKFANKLIQTQPTLTIPYVSTAISLTAGTELTAMAQSNPAFSVLTFTLAPYQCTVPYSKQILRSTNANGYDIQGTIIKEAMIADDTAMDALFKTRLHALGETYCVAASAAGLGINTAQTGAQALTSTTVANAVLGATFGKLDGINARYTDGASIVMHPSLYWQLVSLADSDNSRNVFEFNANQAYWRGYPVYKSSAFTAPTVALTASGACLIGVGNFGDALCLADTGMLDIQLFQAGSTPDINLITQYAEAYRVVHEFDIQLKKRMTFFGASI